MAHASTALDVMAAVSALRIARDERFDRVTRLAKQMFDVSMAGVSILDTEQLFAKSATDAGSGRPQFELQFCGITITRPRQTFVVEDATGDARFRDNPQVISAPYIRFYAGHPLEAPNGDILGTLCVMDTRPRQFSAIDRAALRDLAVGLQKELAATAEMSMALSVQNNLLPASAPKVGGYEVAGACLPSQGVSGDFFDWRSTPDGLTLVVADVMGKGVAAAMIGSAVRTAFRMADRLGGVSETLASVSEAVDEDLMRNDSFVTAFYARLEESTGRLQVVDAGHGLSIILRADGSREVIPTANLPIGVLRGQEWEWTTITLGVGDELLVFSDGILEVFDGSMDSLDDAASVVSVAQPTAQDGVDAIMRLASFERIDDDVTVVAVRRTS